MHTKPSVWRKPKNSMQILAMMAISYKELFVWPIGNHIGFLAMVARKVTPGTTFCLVKIITQRWQKDDAVDFDFVNLESTACKIMYKLRLIVFSSNTRIINDIIRRNLSSNVFFQQKRTKWSINWRANFTDPYNKCFKRNWLVTLYLIIPKFMLKKRKFCVERKCQISYYFDVQFCKANEYLSLRD